MILLGFLGVAAALGAAFLALLLGAAAAATRRDDLLTAARRAVVVCSFFTTLGVVGLVYAIIAGDYQMMYVFAHSDHALPLLYKIGALWGGMEGSLLFWSWLLALFATAVVMRHRRDGPALLGPAISVLMVVELFFLALVVFFESPWARSATIPVDGRGLNPLLQHPAMVFHPPCLYLGFIGMTVPFAFAMAALFSRQMGDDWIRKSRPWAVLAWLFLAAGNVLGARWAYVELGWGGYWAWDPVENAAFMPWLANTAYLHSVMIQERKGMLKIWNMLLVITAFLLTIFGTFITRSGLISSVHSFAQSNIGYLFAGFLVFLAVISFGLVWARRHDLKSAQQLDSFFSRESSFLLNNLILLGGAFAVLWGTVFPMVSEAVRGVRLSVGPPFFNQIMVPIGLALLALMGIGPIMAWRRMSARAFFRASRVPLVLGGIAVLILLALGVSHAYALVTFSLCAFVLATIVAEYVSGVRARRAQSGEPAAVAFLELLRRAPRRFGGYIIHAGVVLIFLGFGGAAFNKEHEATLSPGESTDFRGHRLTFNGLHTRQEAGVDAVGAEVELSRDGEPLARLFPQKNFYPKNQQMASEVAIHSNLGRDFYVVLADYDLQNERASFKAYFNPLVSWFWIGGIVTVLGGILVLVPLPRARARARAAGRNATRAAAIWLAALLAAGPAGLGMASAGPGEKPITVDQVASRLMDPCPDCRGKQLTGCDCGGAGQAKDEIRAMIAEGRTEEEIVADFRQRYGEWILAAPEKQGFSLVGYVLPFAALAAGAGGVWLFLRKSVRRSVPARAPGVPGGVDEFPLGDVESRNPGGGAGSLDAADRARLERELRRLDGELLAEEGGR